MPCNYHIIFLFIHDYWLEIFSTNQIHLKKITILCWLNNITNDFWKLVQSCRDFLLLLQLLFDYNCVNKFVFCPKAILNLISYKLDWWDFTGKRSPYLQFNAHICKQCMWIPTTQYVCSPLWCSRKDYGKCAGFLGVFN